MDRRVQKNRKAILEAYMTLVSDPKGKKVTVSEIARLADIDRKTFYAHYESVDDILKDFWEERIRELLQKLEKTSFFREPINLQIIYEELNHIIWRDMEFYRQLATNSSYDYFWNQIHEIVVRALLNAYASQVRMSEKELKMYCDFFVAGISRLYQDYLRHPDEETARMMGQVIVDTVQHGAMRLAESGREKTEN